MLTEARLAEVGRRLDQEAAERAQLDSPGAVAPEWEPFPPSEAYADVAPGSAWEPKARPATANCNTEVQAKAFAVLWFASLADAVHQRQLVTGLLLSGSLFVVFGESNSGKTFFMLDLALAIAAGIPWRGRKVQQGLVVYVAGEGAASVRNRVAAYRQAHPEIPADTPFVIIPAAVSFLSLLDAAKLIATIRAAELECGHQVVLIVVDTLARSMAGGDENSAEDMGRLVANADYVRAETGAALGFVHHSGKDAGKGARGHSSLRAAIDTEISVEGQSGTRTASVTKQRDLPGDGRFAFELLPVVIGQGEEGESVTSCTVRYADAPAQPKGKAAGINQQRAVAAVKEWVRTNPEASFITSADAKELLKAQSLDYRRRHEVLKFLVDVRVLTPSVGGYTVDGGML
jgi:hypothetical protein